MGNKQDKKKKHRNITVLLLGAGESGKSTIFKQMKIIHHMGFTKEEQLSFKPIIYSNILRNMKALVTASLNMGITIEKSENREKAHKIDSIKSNDLLNIESVWSKKLGHEIRELWLDDGLQKTYEERHNFQLDDTAKYYFDDLERLLVDDYVPTVPDILRSRVKTGGSVSETTFDLAGNTVKLIDVGGQRSERKKWIHCFEGVNAIIFVTSLSEYNQKCYEDDETNRMKESLLVFDEIVNSRWFVSTPIILFLNKEDIFKEKIKVHDLKVCFSNYTGGLDSKAAVKYIAQKFIEKNKTPELKKIYIHVTCATNTDQLKEVFNSSDIKEVLLRDDKMV